jgi:CheY-like chemotaxis protein
MSVGLPQAAPEWKKYKILIVDDEHSVRKQLHTELRLAGFDVQSAESGEAGLQILESFPAKLVLSDQKMKGMSGTEFLTEVKKRYPHVITMILSAYSESADVMNAVNKAGAFHYLMKPWTKEDVVMRISHGLQLYHAQAEQRRLAEANRRLLEKMATMQNFSLIGNFSYALYDQFYLVIQEKLRDMRRRMSLERLDDGGSTAIMENQNWLRMSGVIKRLGQLGKLHQLPAKWSQETLRGLIDQCVEDAEYASKAEGHHVVFKVTVDEELPLIWMQRDVLTTALNALIENAVIFNRRSKLDGPKNVFIDIKHVKEPENLVVIDVRDDGTGSEADDKIFAPLYTTYPQEASSAYELGSIGTFNFGIYYHLGLGLPIARWCVARHDGRLTLHESSRESGSCFRIEIPLAQRDLKREIDT